MTEPAPDRRAFIHDDLSMYERISPDEFPDYDDIDSRDVRVNDIDAQYWQPIDGTGDAR